MFATAIFLGAFLLLQIQPLLSKFILPWFGGCPAVWTTTMLFFQTLLFGGYVYAHLLQRALAPRRQAVVHLALALLAVCLLPVVPDARRKPTDSSMPTWRILALLTAAVGLPYFVLAATSPLVQAWFSRCWPGRSPYRLYALSNAGSLLALLSYRLPTEAEWEYACRAGTTARYATGDDPAAIARRANIVDQSGRTEFPHVQEIMMPTDGKFTVPVGSYPANGFGLCDMHGNVWQWCADWYGKDYYGKSPVDDPAGPESGRQRVRRGGGWNSFPLYARASFRNWNTPVSRCVNLGFRVLLESNESATRPAPAPGRPDR
jgi:hypothetical protein